MDASPSTTPAQQPAAAARAASPVAGSVAGRPTGHPAGHDAGQADGFGAALRQATAAATPVARTTSGGAAAAPAPAAPPDAGTDLALAEESPLSPGLAQPPEAGQPTLRAVPPQVMAPGMMPAGTMPTEAVPMMAGPGEAAPDALSSEPPAAGSDGGMEPAPGSGTTEPATVLADPTPPPLAEVASPPVPSAMPAPTPPTSQSAQPPTGAAIAGSGGGATAQLLAAARPGKAGVAETGGPTAPDAVPGGDAGRPPMVSEGGAGVPPGDDALAAAEAMADDAELRPGLAAALAEGSGSAGDPLGATAGFQAPAAGTAQPNGPSVDPTNTPVGQGTAGQTATGQTATGQTAAGQAAGIGVSAGLATSGLAGAEAIPAGPAVSPPRQPSPAPFRQVAPIAIALALAGGQSPRLTVALEPEELGRVEIRIERVGDTDAATVHVLAERPETLALLQRDSRELDRALQQAGVKVAEGGTSFGLGTEERPAREQAGGRRQPGRPLAAATTAATLRPAGAGLSLLDIAV